MAGLGRQDETQLTPTRLPREILYVALNFFGAIPLADVDGCPPSPQVKRAVNPESGWVERSVFSSVLRMETRKEKIGRR